LFTTPKSNVPWIYRENFTSNLRNYIASNASVDKQYKRTVDVASASSNVKAAILTATHGGADFHRGKVLTYDVPPEHCPYCQSLYQVADFSTCEVYCKHCGGRINIRCVIDPKDIETLINLFLKRITRQTKHMIKIFLVLCIITGLLTKWLLPEPFQLEAYLFSARVIPFVFFYIFLCFSIWRIVKFFQIKRIAASNFALAKLEYFVKDDNDSDFLASFHQFKKDLIGLYRKQPHSLKSDLL
jgi:hypothetical protein